MPPLVLIVEDEALIAESHRLCVEDMGWSVLGPVPSVKAALALLEMEVPSIAILDINLRKELVTPVAQALKNSNIPFIVASASADPVELGGPVFVGVPNVSKPVDDRVLSQALWAALPLASVRNDNPYEHPT